MVVVMRKYISLPDDSKIKLPPALALVLKLIFSKPDINCIELERKEVI